MGTTWCKETSVISFDDTFDAGWDAPTKLPKHNLTNLLSEKERVCGDRRALTASRIIEVLTNGVLVLVQYMNGVETHEDFAQPHVLFTDKYGEVLYLLPKNEAFVQNEHINPPFLIDICEMYIEEIPIAAQSRPSIKLSDQIQNVQLMAVSKEEHGSLLFGLECARERRLNNLLKKRNSLVRVDSENDMTACFGL